MNNIVLYLSLVIIAILILFFLKGGKKKTEIKEWGKVTPFVVKPWLSLGLGISICFILGIIVGVITADIWWGVVELS